jgi:hypothetical protein
MQRSRINEKCVTNRCQRYASTPIVYWNASGLGRLSAANLRQAATSISFSVVLQLA